MDAKTTIYDYLRQNEHMALATANKDAQPSVATVGYVLDGDTLLFNTYTHYRKYQNLANNTHVACVITVKHDKTLQLEGQAEQLEGEDAERAKQKMLDAEPGYIEFISHPDTRFFRITPVWMRLRDYTKTPLQEIVYEG